jgi:hypothetical protein
VQRTVERSRAVIEHMGYMEYQHTDSALLHTVDHYQRKMTDYSSYMGQDCHMVVELLRWLELTDYSSHLEQGYYTVAEPLQQLKLEMKAMGIPLSHSVGRRLHLLVVVIHNCDSA